MAPSVRPIPYLHMGSTLCAYWHLATTSSSWPPILGLTNNIAESHTLLGCNPILPARRAMWQGATEAWRIKIFGFGSSFSGSRRSSFF